MTKRTDGNNTGLSSSLEDYLERIQHLQNIHSYASCSEIGVLMNVNRTSVTSALRSLSELGLVNYKPYGKVTLTEKGMRIAEDVATRHDALRDFLSQFLLLPVDAADCIACGMEHALTLEVAMRLNDFMSYIEPRMPKDWEKCLGRCLDAGRDAAYQKRGKETPAKNRDRRTKEAAGRVAHCKPVTRRAREAASASVPVGNCAVRGVKV
ncbi:MAG: metal-dependent transcriptional regulator [Planctomycetota bacterium]|nr:metal-dependent transcriptional regulator [Planctomycetota bacterium]